MLNLKLTSVHSKVNFNGLLLWAMVLILLLSSGVYAHSNAMENKLNDSTLLQNKIIPHAILEEVKTALSFYPELADTPIEFKFKKKIKKSFMQAQPRFSGIFKKRKNRGYVILISEKLQIEDEAFEISQIPSDVMIGWIGHELGHIMDYRDRKGFNLLVLGCAMFFPDVLLKKLSAQQTPMPSTMV